MIEREIKNYSRQMLIPALQEEVFSYMDNISNTGMHMRKSSGMMMGSKLFLEDLDPQASGAGKTYRWYGKIMGLKMDFSVKVTKWIEGKEKKWETIGEPKMIILKWYRMYLHLMPAPGGTLAELGIDYTLPDNWFFRIISYFLAPWYARWCVRKMLKDTRSHFTQKPASAPA